MKADELNRTIVHMDLDTFFVSVERLLDPSLYGRPVIVGGAAERGVVSACSYEARHFGVRSAMPMHEALRRCKSAVVCSGNREAYKLYSRRVTDIIADCAPVYEQASVDEFYLDITGMDRFFGCMQWAHELRMRIISETKLPISFGLANSKCVAKIATGEAKPNGEIEVTPAQVLDFLAPLSIRKIPMLGAVAFEKLSAMGISTIAELRQVPVAQMEQLFGKSGIVLWNKARGIDASLVRPHRERKSISTERTFSQDITEVSKVYDMLINMSGQLGFQLRSKNRFCSCISIKIRYHDFKTYIQQQQITKTSFDHVIASTGKSLFDQLYKKGGRIRLIGLKISQFSTGAEQLDLFDNSEEVTNLYKTLDTIKTRYGKGVIKRGTGF